MRRYDLAASFNMCSGCIVRTYLGDIYQRHLQQRNGGPYRNEKDQMLLSVKFHVRYGAIVLLRQEDLAVPIQQQICNVSLTFPIGQI